MEGKRKFQDLNMDARKEIKSDSTIWMFKGTKEKAKRLIQEGNIV